jgi:hypothetical protein
LGNSTARRPDHEPPSPPGSIAIRTRRSVRRRTTKL